MALDTARFASRKSATCSGNGEVGADSRRLFVLGAHALSQDQEGRCYYRQKAYLLCDDNKLAAKELLAGLLRSLAN